MNQVDWEKMQEKIEIIDVLPVNNTWIQNPSNFEPIENTSLVSGDLSNLTLSDENSLTLNSYFSGINLNYYIDTDLSNVDSILDRGTHSNFSAQQYGPDLNYDILSEQNTKYNSTMLSDGFESIIWNENWNDLSSNWQEDNDPVKSGTSSARGFNLGEGPFTCDNLDMSQASAIYIDFWFRKDDTESFDFTLYYYDGTSYDLIEELDDNGSDDIWLHYSEKIIDPQYFISDFRIRFDATLGGGENVWVDDVLIVKESPDNFEIDLEIQWSDVDFSQINEELCIFVGSVSDEILKLDYWSGSQWEPLINNLLPGWNNISISSLLIESTFTIRFKGNIEISDQVASSWNIDAALLHVWTNKQSVEVIFTGYSNTDEWSQLIWNSDISWSSENITVIIQLYNYADENYPINGPGYLTYESSFINIYENMSQTISSNPTDFRNETGHWKLKITGTSNQSIEFSSKIDCIAVTETAFGALVTIQNEGSLTSHIESLWIINSTKHQRFEIDTFIGAGELSSILFTNIILPFGSSITKLTTERGNIAVFSIE